MPVFFKIIIFFFLQQGLKPAQKDNSIDSANASWQNFKVVPEESKTLVIQADHSAMAQALQICQSQDRTCLIVREPMVDPVTGLPGFEKASVVFSESPFSKRNRVVERLRSLENRLIIQ